jgi:hypothetical protein
LRSSEKEKTKKRKRKRKENEEGNGRVMTVDGCGRSIFVPGGIPGTNVIPHLYIMVCTGWIADTNEDYQPVQMSVFPVVNRDNN